MAVVQEDKAFTNVEIEFQDCGHVETFSFSLRSRGLWLDKPTELKCTACDGELRFISARRLIL